MKYCSYCGTQLEDEMKFCYNCGAKVTRECTKCGAILKDDAEFCHQCGTPVNSKEKINNLLVKQNTKTINAKTLLIILTALVIVGVVIFKNIPSPTPFEKTAKWLKQNGTEESIDSINYYSVSAQ